MVLVPGTRYHCHFERAGLIEEVVKLGPAKVFTGDLGRKTTQEAIEAVLALGTPCVVVGDCSNVAEDGRCAGHPITMDVD